MNLNLSAKEYTKIICIIIVFQTKSDQRSKTIFVLLYKSDLLTGETNNFLNAFQ